MAEPEDDPRVRLDIQINSPGREGLTGTTPETLYAPVAERDQVTIPPDWRPIAAQPAWRHDFPIDWPQDHYVERRDFMKFLVLTSAAFTAGQFWIVAQNWWRARAGRPPIRRVASLDTLPVGGAVLFEYPEPGEMCVLVRLAEDVVVAYSQQCTHLSCAVVPKPERGVLHCPCHEGYFDLRSGEPVAGPPRRPLPRIALEIRGRDVYAIDVEVRTT
ncbi:MAG TPA: Rieske 2Fe-2S domain-containing protein [Vicinamibacterales bacterium]